MFIESDEVGAGRMRVCADVSIELVLGPCDNGSETCSGGGMRWEALGGVVWCGWQGI